MPHLLHRSAVEDVELVGILVAEPRLGLRGRADEPHHEAVHV